MTDITIAGRLARLRDLLKQLGLAGLVVPRADAHQSEVCAPHDNCLEYISGFTGSAGLALILQEEALIFVDGRYQIQVRNEVDMDLFQVHHLYDAPMDIWLKDNARAGWRIAFDPMLVNSDLHDRLHAALSAANATLTPLETDLFDVVWTDRPPKPLGSIRAMPPSVSGETSAAKRERIAARLAENGAGLLIETLPDNIAWLLNVRGSDVPMNPVPHSFLLLDAAGAVEWFVDHRKLGNDRSGYELEGVALADPDDFYRRISDRSMGKLAMIDPQFTPVGVRMAVKQGGGRVIGRSSPLTLAKAMKSAAELEGYRQCHLEDGAALSDFLAWVMREGRARESSDNPLTELEAEAKLLAFRQERPGFLEASFRSISASAANAAMCHYNATPHTNTVIDSASPYLIDSGGQYLNGTTDVTRTIMLGEATAAVRRTYTAVLKGFLSLLMAQMPVGTKGHQLDAFARRPLWDLGLDYDHGTGHGVGHNMLVHEYPHRFSKVGNPHGLVPGNIMTIEPGYYEAGEYGLRIENQVEVVAASPGFCRFESLTLAPIDLVAVDLSALTTREILFLDAYHAKVRDALLPRVREDTRAFLMEQTRSVSER